MTITHFCPPFIDEFKVAIFHMNSDKLPRPDGLNLAFYKQNMAYVWWGDTTWFETGNFSPQVNNTSIVLIPKTLNPTTMKDFRSISLCNVLYKITSKVLASILKSIIHNCISQEQVVFVENRSILDNVLLASEIIHHMKCKHKGKVGEVALKIDINKAFDCVDWNFLFDVLHNMGFND